MFRTAATYWNHIFLVGILGLNLFAAPVSFAEEIEIGSELSDGNSFNVQELLTAGSEENTQEQSYFDESERPPIFLFILQVINFITRILGTLAMVLIILGGMMMIVSEGDENRLQKGKGILEAAIIGLIISLASYVIVRFVQSLFYLQ